MHGALLVNFFGGPGAGKTSMAADVFGKLKWRGINAEYVQEYAKDLVWSDALGILENQVGVFGEQQHRSWRVANKVRVIVTDSPLLLTTVYDREKSPWLRGLVLEHHNKFRSLNFYLNRVKEYSTDGRLQDEEGARGKDREVHAMLEELEIPHIHVPGQEDQAAGIVKHILTVLRDYAVLETANSVVEILQDAIEHYKDTAPLS